MTSPDTLISNLCSYIEDTWSESEGLYPLTDAGCIDCTNGTVPNTLNTGLCPYHEAKRHLDKMVEEAVPSQEYGAQMSRNRPAQWRKP